jgi:hypothetical protein
MGRNFEGRSPQILFEIRIMLTSTVVFALAQIGATFLEKTDG